MIDLKGQDSTVILFAGLAVILWGGRGLCALYGFLLLRKVAASLVRKESLSLVASAWPVIWPVGEGWSAMANLKNCLWRCYCRVDGCLSQTEQGTLSCKSLSGCARAEAEVWGQLWYVHVYNPDAWTRGTVSAPMDFCWVGDWEGVSLTERLFWKVTGLWIFCWWYLGHQMRLTEATWSAGNNCFLDVLSVIIFVFKRCGFIKFYLLMNVLVRIFFETAALRDNYAIGYTFAASSWGMVFGPCGERSRVDLSGH